MGREYGGDLRILTTEETMQTLLQISILALLTSLGPVSSLDIGKKSDGKTTPDHLY